MDSDGNTSGLVEVQKTANTGLKAKSTCTYFNLGDGRSAVYFGVVDLLDYDTDVFIETVNFGFSLPEWANEQGDYVVIENIGEVQISAVGYSETYGAFILEFDIAYTGSPVERKISALYNLNPYEVYEVSTDMSTTPSKFNIVTECGVDANNINFTYISETIEIVEDDDFLLRIDYWDKENKGGMVYQTGIKNRIRMFGKMNYMGDQETEGYNGDQEYFVTDNVIYNSSELIINRLTSAMAHKMRLVLSHSELYINGIRSKLYESPEISGDENNNFKQFKALVKQSGNEFLTDAQEQITSEGGALSAAIEAAQDKSFLLWTKKFIKMPFTQEQAIQLLTLLSEGKLISELTELLTLETDNNFVAINSGSNDARKIKIPLLRGYKGTYNASTNTPSLSNTVGLNGDMYVVSVAGSRDFGAGTVNLLVDDIIIYLNGKYLKANGIVTGSLDLQGVYDNSSPKTITVADSTDGTLTVKDSATNNNRDEILQVQDTSGNILFYVQRDKVYIKDNLGIGTENPNAKLEITTDDKFLRLSRETDNLDYYEIKNTHVPSEGLKITLRSNYYNDATSSRDPRDVISFTPIGDVGIGTENPTEKLEVEGMLKSQMVI